MGRYAPSPTGALHLGNLRTALAAFAHIRRRAGRFLLRIEDLDTPRVRSDTIPTQLRDLEALGIEWDEAPLRQSERAARYADALSKLTESGKAYPCFCSRKDIRLALSAPHRSDRIQGYPGTCSALPSEEAAERIAAGEQHAWRLRVDDAPRVFEDGFAGRCPVDLPSECGDFVVRRGDGLFAYQLACALDDAHSGVTEVLRGADLLDSGARQAWLLESLGLPVPRYFHIPLLHGANGERLSKRDGADDLAACLARGFDVAAVRGYLAWTLGQCERGERIAMEDLCARFDLQRIPREGAVYCEEDLAAFRA